MPRPLKTWGCDFRCGYVNSKLPKIVKHERTCFENPERRACRTCKHDIKGVHPDDCYCAIDFNREDDDAPLRPSGEGERVTCRADCPSWEAKP